MKKFFNLGKYAEFWKRNKDIIIILTLLFGIPWSFFMALETINFKFLLDFLFILPFGLLGGFFFGIFFPVSMQIITGDYIIPYISARLFRITLHKYKESVEYYKTAINILKASKPKGQKKKMKKSYLLGAYNDLAICYSKLKDRELAEEYIKKAVRYLPQNKKQKYLDKMYKKYVNNEQEHSSGKKNIIKIVIISAICICSALTYIIDTSIFCEDCSIVIVSTDNNKTLNNVQNTFLKYFDRLLTEQDGIIYHISIINPKKYGVEHAILRVADSKYFDDTIEFSCISDRKNFFRKNYVKKLKRRLERVIVCIDGVTNADVKITIPAQSMFEIEKPISVVVTIKNFVEHSDVEKAKKLITNVLLGGVPGLSKEDITLDIEVIKSSNEQMANVYYYNAKDNFLEKEYDEALANLALATKYDNNYERQYEDLKRFLELNKLIAKYPKNYRLYIERGDLQNIPQAAIFFSIRQGITSNYEGAIEDYNKALELNPKAYEVYEKRGDAWAKINHNSDETSTRELRYPEDDQHVIDDYTKAIELTGGNDRLYEKLGDRFTDPQIKLSYYKQIKNPFNEYDRKIVPPIKKDRFDFFFGHNTHGYVPFKLVNCYAKLGEYNESLEILDKVIEHKEYVQEAYNLKFIYNWKAGHYKEALKSADNCSVWVCKIAGIFF